MTYPDEFLDVFEVAVNEFSKENTDTLELDTRKEALAKEAVSAISKLDSDIGIYEFGVTAQADGDLVFTFEFDYFNRDMDDPFVRNLLSMCSSLRITKKSEETSEMMLVSPGIWNKIKRS